MHIHSPYTIVLNIGLQSTTSFVIQGKLSESLQKFYSDASVTYPESFFVGSVISTF